ncbi:hypothetical protein V8E36_001298 [Tilletia maclaganii]
MSLAILLNNSGCHSAGRATAAAAIALLTSRPASSTPRRHAHFSPQQSSSFTPAHVGLRPHATFRVRSYHHHHHPQQQQQQQQHRSRALHHELQQQLPTVVAITRSSLRSLSTSSSPRSSTTTSAPAAPASSSPSHDILATYTGPLHKTFRRLKVFSLSSLAFASILTPYLLIGPGSLDTGGRIVLVLAALGASSLSTALISWIGKPYVGKLELVRVPVGKEEKQQQDPLPPSSTRLIAETTSWRLQPLRTTIFQPSYIRGTSRPFAAWQLAAEPTPIPALPRSETSTSSAVLRSLIAETRHANTDQLVGRYWVEWRPDALTKVISPSSPSSSSQAGEGEDEGAAAAAETEAEAEWRMQGVCKVEGKPVTHFNVHEELLDDEWRVLE